MRGREEVARTLFLLTTLVTAESTHSFSAHTPFFMADVHGGRMMWGDAELSPPFSPSSLCTTVTLSTLDLKNLLFLPVLHTQNDTPDSEGNRTQTPALLHYDRREGVVLGA